MASADELRTELDKLTKEELIEFMIEKQNKINSPELKEVLPFLKSKIQNVKSFSPEKKPAKQNTPGLGIEYEVHIPANFALLLNTNPEIEDFKLRSNCQDFENLDDLLVDIKTKSGENLYFAFQLKHKENSSKNIIPTNFEEKGEFNLEKYCEAFKNLSEENRNKYHFILYTNKKFDPSRTSEVEKFDMRQDECSVGRNFFDTSGEGRHLYRFEVNGETEDGKNVNKDDYREFFSKFSLYTGQTNIRDLGKSHILEILKYKECYATYIDFFRRWHRGDFLDKILDKKTLNIHLLDIFLSSVAINYHFSDGQDGNSNLFETMVQQFDVTIIDVSTQDFIKQLEEKVHKYPEEFNKQEDMIRLAKDYKIIDRFTNELKGETKLKLLHYFFQKPLILDLNKSSEDVIYEASKLCKIHENGIKLVILGKDIDISKFSHLKIFTNLTEVDENCLEEIKKRCSLSLQGRNISFEAIFEDEIREFVTPIALFQMLKGNFSIGEDKENLPEYYMPRTVSARIFDIESIIKHSSRRAAIIFYYEDKFEELKILIQIQNILEREDCLYLGLYVDDVSGAIKPFSYSKRNFQEYIPTIILRKADCSTKQLGEILKYTRKRYVYSFKVIDGKRCLLMSTNNISHIEDYKYTKMSAVEKKIHLFSNNSVNILCAQPGMGKSTLMKYLKNECDLNFWTVMVDLKAHNKFLKRNHNNIEDVLNYFLELENCKDLFLLNIKRMFLRKRKIVFFLDGLDELSSECVVYVLNITRQLSEMGFRIWLSSRQNLQQKLENYFNIFAIEIDELNEIEKTRYIENRLTAKYNENEIEEIVKKIFNNTDVSNNCQILGIPLQLQIITQIFIDDKSLYSNLSEKNLILTKMYDIFFEGKCKHFITKLGLESSRVLGKLKEQLENYEIIAIHSVLNDADFQKLQIGKLKLTQIKNLDFLGIITEVNSENKAVFEHLTFAEYFASKFLVKNFYIARILKEEIFAEKYQNLLLIFNIMLTEDSPLHLAIIYNDLSRIEEMSQSSLVDKGGRNFLQVAACVATRHPPLQSHPVPSSQECVVNDFPVKHFTGEDLKTKEIVNRVLSCEPFKNDNIFEWNSMDYALATGALYVVEAILEKSKTPPNFYKMLGKYYSDEVVAYYSIRFGYHRLLSMILVKKTCHVTRIVSGCFSNSIIVNSILHFLFLTSNRTNKSGIVELLTSDDINKTVHDEDGYYTFLYFAIIHDDTELIKFLLEKGVDVNIKDEDGWSPLLLVIERNNLEMSKLLIEKGADVNVKDEDGWSALLLAVERNNLEISKMLIEKGADVNMNNLSESLLFWAVERNSLEFAKLLIENGADVNAKDENGWSPLLLAIQQDNVEILKLLVEKGADVNIRAKGLSPLLLAVERNNLEISKLLIEKGADVDIKNEYGRSPLLLAVKRNYLKISKLLVTKGAAVNIKAKDGWSPLLLAVEQNNLGMSKLLVENGADVNIKDENGWSLLLLAVERNNLEILKLLIEKGANVNIKDEDGRSPLLFTIERNILEMSKLLVEKGADVNMKDKNGRSSLVLALHRNNLEISKLLIENRADVNIKDENGWSLLLLAVELNNLELTKLLVEKGADVNIKAKDGWSPLLLALKRNYLKISKLLVTQEADVNIKAKDGWSPLLLAVERNNLEISKLLIEKEADVNVKDEENERSPLFLAVQQDNVEISKLLVEKGADVNIKDSYGASPLFIALELNNLEISKLLVDKGADVNIKDEDGASPLLWAVEQNNLEASKLIIEKEADVNIKAKNGWSPLLLAVKRNYFEISKLLVEKGADVNIKDEDGWSPLLLAVQRDNFEILKLLVEKGADVNIKDYYGSSPLFMAVKRNYFKISKFLIEKGANINTKNGDGTSPLFWAVEQNNFEMSKLLIEKGADINIRNESGWSPLFWAVKTNNLEISKLLVENGADVNIKDEEHGRSPLFWAVHHENFKILKLLVKKGTDINIKDTLLGCQTKKV